MFHLGFIVLALIYAVSAAPNGPTLKLCPQSISTNFSDLPALIAGTTGTVTFVPNPYRGLDYSSAWRVTQAGTALKPGPKSIIFGLQSDLLTTAPTISVDRTSCQASLYRLQSFAWFAALDLAQPDLTATVSATLKLTGTKPTGQTVTASCDYQGGELISPPLGINPTPATCTLPKTFDLVTDVKYEVTSASATSAMAEIVVAQIDYVLYKCCH